MAHPIQQVEQIVIGGGAAGFFAAIRARQLAPHKELLLLEAAPKALGKVKISGGGRCNVTHACFDVGKLVQSYPRNPKALRTIFSRFGPQNTVSWFEDRGVALKTEADGRIFPVSDDSQTIINALLQSAQKAGVQIQTASPVKSLTYQPEEGFSVFCENVTWRAQSVLVACGGSPRAYPWLEAMGHSIIPPVPSLFSFNIQDPLLQDLAGISFPWVKGRLEVAGEKPLQQEGPLLITHWGLSGPVILRLSAWGARHLSKSHYQATLRLDLLPQSDYETCRQQLLDQKQHTPKRHLGTTCPWDLPKRFWQRILTNNEVSPELLWGDIANKTLNRLVEAVKVATLQVNGKGAFKDEFVTAGGVCLKEIDLSTMESKRVPGLFLAGEILDVDGLTGGFNFQNAWSTGWIAGEAMAAHRRTSS